MEKISIIQLILWSLFFTNYSLGQIGWYWQNPRPQGNDLNSVSFLNANTGFAVGKYGTIIKTTNKGEIWSEEGLINTVNFFKIKFIDNNTGYLLRSDNSLMKTTNAGNNWSTICTLSSSFSKLTFYNSNTGLIASDKLVLKTTNGGINWFNYYSASSVTTINDICYVSDSHTFIAGYFQYPLQQPYGVYYYTTNSGQNWTNYIFNNVNCLNSLQFININTGYLVGSNCFFGKTTDGGNSWLQITIDTNHANLSNVQFINLQTGFVLPNYRTSNGGLNWLQTNASNGNSFYFSDNNTLILVGNDGIISKSTNTGNNFVDKRYSVTSERLYSIHCVSENVFYAAGGNGGTSNPGIIIKTTNGGINWFNQQSGINNYIGKIRFLNESDGVALSPRYLLHTSNGGNNWTIKYNISTGYLEDIYFLDNNTGFIAGRDGIFWKTSNGGTNWSNIPIDSTISYRRITFTNQQTGFVTGTDWPASKPSIYKTTNRGINWISYSGPHYSNDIYFINENTGLTAGWDGEIFRTTNGGTLWNQIVSPTNDDLNSIAFINENTGFIVGRSNIILLKSTNSGLNWYSEYVNLQWDEDWLQGISSINGKAVFVGDNGMIKSSFPISSINIKYINEPITSNFSLSQNYPNPFNPTTTISYKVKSYQVIKLIVYDILGKEVAVLVNEKLQPGEYETQFPNNSSVTGNQLPSGIYFYTLFADGEKIDTKKMVLIK